VVARNDRLKEAADAIDEALREFVQDRACDAVCVFDTEYGHLRALIGSDAFKDMSLGQRQQLIWDYLREHVKPEHLAFLIGVHPMDHAEYDEQVKEV
jgi:stress-induced morphogen